MAVTRQDLFDFTRFAEEKLTDRGTDSLKALLDEWNERRSHGQSVAGIRESVAQYEAGEGLPIREAFAEIRRKLGRAE
jgi:hypothetical protein